MTARRTLSWCMERRNAPRSTKISQDASLRDRASGVIVPITRACSRGAGSNLIKVRDDSQLSAVAAKLVHPLGRWSDGAAAGLYVSSSGHAHSTYSWQYSGGHWRDLGPGGIKGRKTLMTRLGPLSLKRTSF